MALEARIDRLEATLLRLAEAQAHAEERFVRLEEAQARTEARMEELAAAQARTEARMEELAAAQTRMAAAQARTEARMEELAAAQARTDAHVEQLAAAQARTELAVQALAQQVGRLADTIGFTLEDLAREVTPAYLAQHYNIHVPQLDRHFIVVGDQELEFDIYGNGQRNGERVTVVGEVHSRIYGRDVEDAVRRTARLARELSGIPVTVLFGFVIHPSAREAAQRLGAIVISSSGR
jgi:multidrug efflux pump subunit AcrA (membrane-fusion protein)